MYQAAAKLPINVIQSSCKDPTKAFCNLKVLEKKENYLSPWFTITSAI